MKLFMRGSAFLLSAALAAGLMGTSAFAAGASKSSTTILKNSAVTQAANNENLLEYRGTIQDRHGVQVKDIAKFFQASDSNDPLYTLRILNNTLYLFPKGMVNELTTYYENKDISTLVRLGYKDGDNIMDGTFEITDTQAIVTIYHTPLGWAGLSSSTSSYDAPLTVAHEFGHYVQQYLWDVYGKDDLQSDWRKIARTSPYGSWRSGYENSFTRAYATSSYEEDFADVFGYMIAHPDELAERVAKNPDSVLAKKVKYMEKIIAENFTADLDLSAFTAIYDADVAAELEAANAAKLKDSQASDSAPAADSESSKSSADTENTSIQKVSGRAKSTTQNLEAEEIKPAINAKKRIRTTF